MRYTEILFESERTLYHGTLVANVPSIMRDGLEPGVGQFTNSFYGDEDEEELDHLVFAADKKGLRACVSAILGYLRIKNIPFTEENFYRYGALVVIRGENDSFEQRPRDHENDYVDHPGQVEPGDYYSRDAILPSHVLVRDKLRSFIRRNSIDLGLRK